MRIKWRDCTHPHRAVNRTETLRRGSETSGTLWGVVDPDATQGIGEDAPDGPASELAETEHASTDESPVSGSGLPPRPPTHGQLRRERRRLWDERQETVYHLGGLALYMHSRAMLGDELVERRAEVVDALDKRIATIDEQLAEHDARRRQGRVRVPPAAGYCLSCGAPYQADATFCFRCGARVHVAGEEADTQVIDTSETAVIGDDSTLVIPATPEGR
jgi:hypothetical protein